MRHYLDLIPISAKVRRRQSRMTRLCIVLAVFLVTTIFGMADMEIRAQRQQAIQTDGQWHAGFAGLTRQEAALIKSRPDVKYGSWYAVTNYKLNQGYRIGETETGICGFDQEFLEMFPEAEIVEGRFPENRNEAVATENMKQKNHVKVGDKVSLKMPDGETMEVTISGFCQNMPLVMKVDAFVLFFNTPSYLEAFGKETKPGDELYYVQFHKYCNIQKSLEEIKEAFTVSDREITENTKILALMLQSKDSYMIKLYLTAAVLAVLVIIAGIFMITGSLNSNIAKRTEFFGMLRCLGATKKQVSRFVKREALNWCKTAVPIGVGSGTFTIWILCAVLRYLSPGIFEGMPVWGISWTGIVSGIILGVITVLLAARAPAKKASGVSPLKAASGNAGTVWKVKKAANTRRMRIDTVLGIHHAWGSKKNFFLMSGSFAFSIILFLAFYPTVEFMNHALTPLQPYAADLSLASADRSCSISGDIEEQLAENPAVKRVFGRSNALSVPVLVNGEEKKVNLVSYEKYQFEWAQKEMMKGSLNPVKEGEGVLSVYNDFGSVSEVGSVLEFKDAPKSTKVKVAGIVGESSFHQENGVETIICSRELFQELTGEKEYAIVDIQLEKGVSEEEVEEIRALAKDGIVFSDSRMGNEEVKGAYLSFAMFVYGFLAVIGLIAVFHIINSISMSVSAHIQEYGAMMAIGMSQRQLLKMISAEAGFYGIAGMTAGCLVGIPIHKLLYENMITSRWGDAWRFPAGAVAVIAAVILISLVLAVYGPARQIKNLSVVDTLSVR